MVPDEKLYVLGMYMKLVPLLEWKATALPLPAEQQAGAVAEEAVAECLRNSSDEFADKRARAVADKFIAWKAEKAKEATRGTEH